MLYHGIHKITKLQNCVEILPFAQGVDLSMQRVCRVCPLQGGRTHTHTHTHTTHTRTHARTHTHTHNAHTHARTRTHKQTNTQAKHTHTHIHTCTGPRLSPDGITVNCSQHIIVDLLNGGVLPSFPVCPDFSLAFLLFSW